MTHLKLVTAALLLCSLNAHAQIYRWVDADGQVHFEQRPQPGAEQVEVRPQVVERDERVRQSEATMQRLMDIRDQERQQQRDLMVQHRQDREARCQDMRKRLAMFELRAYWYEEDADGNRVEVSKARLAEAESSLRHQIAEQC